MKERFEGEGQPALVDALKNHQLILGDREIADAFLSVGTLQEFSKGTALITEGTETSDVFLLIAGSVGVVVKSNEVATRRAGEPVGEMAAIEPQPRAASVVAQETVVALKVSAPAFLKIGDDYPRMWKAVAKILARRLLERNKLITAPNNKPRLFVISSAEALATARALQDALARDVLVQVWTDGAFFAGGYNLEALEKAVDASDFAVAIAQPDDVIESKGHRAATLRDNVLFELGLFMGRLKRHRSILLHPRVKELKLPSDLHGLTTAGYEVVEENELSSSIAPAANEIRRIVKAHGVKTQTN